MNMKSFAGVTHKWLHVKLLDNLKTFCLKSHAKIQIKIRSLRWQS